MAIKAHVDDTRTLQEKVPVQYHEFLDVFDEQKSQRLPVRKPWDHAIDIPTDWNPPRPKPYQLSAEEERQLNIFLKDHLRRGLI